MNLVTALRIHFTKKRTSKDFLWSNSHRGFNLLSVLKNRKNTANIGSNRKYEIMFSFFFKFQKIIINFRKKVSNA